MEYHGDLVVFSAVFPSMFHLFLVFERIFRYVFPSFPWFSEWAKAWPRSWRQTNNSGAGSLRRDDLTVLPNPGIMVRLREIIPIHSRTIQVSEIL